MRKIKTWEELTIQDNFLFQKVMQNKRICKHLIELILNIKIKEISFPDSEKTINVRHDSKGIRLDVYVKDQNNNIYDIEMQCTDKPDNELAKRTRYYQGMIDMNLLEKGELYNKLNSTYIIFICTFDPFKKGLPIYTFKNRCLEVNDLELEDQTTKLFLNSKGYSPKIHPDIKAFLRYLDGKMPQGNFVKEIDQEVIRVKRHEETRREYMTLYMEMEELKEEIRKETEKKVISNFTIDMIHRMAKQNMPIKTISEIVGKTPEYVKNIIEKTYRKDA